MVIIASEKRESGRVVVVVVGTDSGCFNGCTLPGRCGEPLEGPLWGLIRSNIRSEIRQELAAVKAREK